MINSALRSDMNSVLSHVMETPVSKSSLEQGPVAVPHTLGPRTIASRS